MKLVYLAAAATMALASTATAAQPTPSFADLLVSSYLGDGAFKTGQTSATNFWTALTNLYNHSGYSSVISGFNSVIASSPENDGSNAEGGNQVVGGNARKGTAWSGVLTFNSARGSISFQNASFSGGSVTVGSQVAVPGPEAGAGIGALTLGGMALYLKRRRKEQNQAA